MLLVNKESIKDLKPTDANTIVYKEVPEGEMWRIDMLKELIEERTQHIEIEGFSTNELDEIVDLLCTS